MKKITLLFLLVLIGMYSRAQCISSFLNPEVVNSNNLGVDQVLNTCSYDDTFAEITGILIGENYIFKCFIDDDVDLHKYITVTDLNNVVLAHGFSPLSVNNIAVSAVRAHYSETGNCATYLDGCNTSTIAIVLSCPIPTNVDVSGVTTSSANFTWNPGGTETTWEVVVLPAGTTPPTNSTSGMTVLFDNHTEFGLIPATLYDFYIRANCGSEFSPWSAPFTFSSGCVGITEFSENFDNVTAPDLPTCWTGLLNGVGVSESSSVTTADVDAYSPTNMVSLYNADAASTANVALVSPNLSNLSAGTHRLKFFAKGTGSIQVGTFSSNTSDAIFTPLQTINTTTVYTEYIVNFTTYSGTNTFIGIRNNSEEFNSINIDNVKWELNPLCPDVVGVNATAIGSNSATISWTAGGSQTLWDVVYAEQAVTDPSTLTPIAPAPTGTPQVTLNGLTENTNYNVWIRTVCGSPNGNGNWIGPLTLKTACLPVSTFDENFDSTVEADLPQCWSKLLSGVGIDASAYITGNDFTFNSPSRAIELNIGGSNPETANIILVSPLLNNLSAGTHRLKFFATSPGLSNVEIGTLSSTANTAVFTPLQLVDITNTFAEYIVDFGNYSGTDTYIGFRQSTTSVYESLFIDDVKWEAAPLCGVVSGINLTNLTTTSATVAWTPSANSAETQWDVVIGDASSTDPDLLTPVAPAPTSTNAVLSNLLPNTTYKIWIRSACGAPNGNGFWIGPYAFTTPCTAVATFEETFENNASFTLPSCWTSIISGDTVSSSAYVTTVENGYLGGNAIELNNDSSNETDNVILVSPNLNNLGNGTHRVRFYARSIFGTTSLQVGSLISPLPNATFIQFQELTLTENYQEFIVDFANYSGSNNYLGFRNANPPYNNILIDEIRWIASPLCADVSGLAISNVTQTAAQLQWNGTGTTNWQVAVAPSDIEDPSSVTPSAVLNSASFSIPDLAPNTTFNAWVRSVCPAPNGNGDWIGPISFTTYCTVSPVQDFVLESFETTETLPSCWSSQLISGTNNWQTKEVNDWEAIATSVTGTRVIFKDHFDSEALLLSLPYNFSSLDASNTAKINLNLHRHQFAAATDQYVIYVNIIPSLTGATQLFVQNSLTTAASGFYNYNINIPATFNGAQQVYIIIKGKTTEGFASLPLAIDDFMMEVDGELALPEFNKNNLSYYPNPVQDFLNVSNNQSINKVQVFNMLGQQVQSMQPNAAQFKMDMTALPQGHYIVRMQTNDASHMIKVIKK